MAEMDTSSQGGGKHKGGKRSKKMSTRVDMTPMVDLGFLLITFFMLTTTFSKPQAMELTMPTKEDNPKEQPPVKASKVLQLVLSENDVIYYFNGTGDPADGFTKVDSVDFTSTKNIRPIIQRHQKEVDAKWGPDKDGQNQSIILIKPKKKSRYKNMVDILDEMSVTDSKRYVIMQFENNDSILINNSLKGLMAAPQ